MSATYLSDSDVLDDLTKLEYDLAKNLRALCDEDGKETNVRESAKILHELGRVYRCRAPDKISLIRSAVLFNAARVRKPDIVDQVKEDLDELCAHVLELACVSTDEANLISKAHLVFRQVDEMRKTVKGKLAEVEAIPEVKLEGKEEQLQKIELVEALQQFIHNRYTEIMRDIMEYCVTIKSPVPCEYALAGMGSLARKEITPYSDFEHVILLEEVRARQDYEEIVEYFRWVSVIFQIILVNLGESIVPSVNLPCLQNASQGAYSWFCDVHTKRGISFDGMLPYACKFPLGRQKTADKPWTTELIKPVSEMLRYLDEDEDLKNGYHLADILTKTCFVAGNPTLHDKFHSGVQATLHKNLTSDQLCNQLQEDLVNFYPVSNLDMLSRNERFNVKRVVYRSTTLFITALGRHYQLKSQSGFDTVRELLTGAHIEEEFAHELQFAVAVACHVRLSSYTLKGKQDDWLESYTNKEDFNLRLVQLMGTSVPVLYFQTAFKLQRKASEVIGNSHSAFVQWSPNLDKLFACYWLQLREQAIEEAESIYLLETASAETKRTLNEVFLLIGHSYFESENYFNALSCYQRVLQAWNSAASSISKDDLAYCTNRVGQCLFELRRFSDASKQFTNELSFRQEVCCVKEDDANTAFCYDKLATCCFEQGQYFAALNFFKKSEHFWETDGNLSHKADLADRASTAGECLCAVKKHSDALKQFEKELAIRKQISDNESADQNIALCYSNTGRCWSHLARYVEAIKFFKKSTEILQENVSHIWKVAQNTLQVGECYFALQKYDDSLSNFLKVLKIRKTLTDEEEADDDLGMCYAHMASCYLDLSKYEEALSLIEKSKTVWQVTGNDWYAAEMAEYRMDLGTRLAEAGKYEEALQEYEKELIVRSRLLDLDDKNRSLAECYNNMADCCFEMERYEQAFELYEKEMYIIGQIPESENVNENIALCYNNMAICKFNLNQFDEAICLYKSSITAWKSVVQLSPLQNIADCTKDIGDCFFEMCRYKDALRQYREELHLRQQTSDHKDIETCLDSVAKCYRKLKGHDKALKFFETLKRQWETESDLLLGSEIAYCNRKIGDSFFALKRYDNAFKQYQDELNIRKLTTKNESFDSDIACCYASSARCAFELKKYNEAIHLFDSAKAIWVKIGHISHRGNIADCSMSKGDCSYELGNYENAVKHYKEELDIRLELTDEKDKDVDIALCYDNVANCLFEQGRYRKALELFKRANDMLEANGSLWCTPEKIMCRMMFNTCFMELKSCK